MHRLIITRKNDDALGARRAVRRGVIFSRAGSGEFVVKTRLSGEACGYPFETGKDYLVYVAKIMGDIETGICTGTRAVVGPDPEMEELDALVERSDD